MAGPSRAEALSFFLRKGTFIWEDTSGSLPLGFCGAGWGRGDPALSGCECYERCAVASVAGGSEEEGVATRLEGGSRQHLPQIAT